MDTERTDNSPYLPATAPEWAAYYKRARETRRLGRGQHAHIKRETAQRRRRANLMLVISTAALVAVVALCYSMLGPSRSAEPEGKAARAATHTA